MLQIEPIQNFNGFGNGLPGEYFYSQGLMRTQNGLLPAWLINKLRDEVDLPDLGLINFFAQAAPAGTMHVYGVDDSGNIYQSENGTSPFELAYKPGVTTFGNGLIGDQKNRLLYAMSRYLGIHDGTPNYTDGTVSVNNSEVVIGDGTDWDSNMVGKRFRVDGDSEFYTIATVDLATYLTLDRPYEGTAGVGKNYTIYVGWDDQFKDFGDDSLQDDVDFRPSDTYEDWVLFGNGNKVAGLNITDDSWNDEVFNFPDKFKVRGVSSGSNGVLFGANFGNYGVLALWDNHSPRSIAPWIWLNAPIQSIAKDNGTWIVVTGRGIFSTNGYTLTEVVPPVDTEIDVAGFSALPQGAVVLRGRLLLANSYTNQNRGKPGAWILNLQTRAWEFAPVSNNCLRGVSMGAIFFDANFKIHIGYTTSKPAKQFIGSLKNNAPTRVVYITHKLGLGAKSKTAKGVQINLGFDQIHTESFPITFNASVKIYNFKRPLWSYANVKTLQTEANKIVVDGTSVGVNNAQVGDEITVLDGVNAGEIRHIITITGLNTSTETWTLDSNLPNMTESAVVLNVSPFQLVSKQAISSVSELKDLYFNVKKEITGRNYLIKLVLENMASDKAIPEIQDSLFIYDESRLI